MADVTGEKFVLFYKAREQKLAESVEYGSVTRKFIKAVMLSFSNIEEAEKAEEFISNVDAAIARSGQNKDEAFLDFVNAAKIETITEHLSFIIEKLRIADVLAQDKLAQVNSAIISLYRNTIANKANVCNKSAIFEASLISIVGDIGLNSTVNKDIARSRPLL